MNNIQVEPPEKRTRTKETKKSSPSSSPLSSFSLLPDEIAVICLARISRSYYPTLSIVSKSFRSILSSTDLYAVRSHIRSTENCVYVCLSDSDRSDQFPQWLRLWVNPNRTRPDSMMEKKKKKKEKTIGQLLVPINSSNFPYLSKSTVVVGSEIYVIGGTVDGAPLSAVRVLDCCNHTWRDVPNMNVARNNAFTCFHDGKIYVAGGCGVGVEPWAEVFDTTAQTWECLPDPGSIIRNRFVYGIVVIDGMIHFDNGITYDTKQCKWEACELNKIVPLHKSECMMENVCYYFGNCPGGRYGCFWYDIKIDGWKEVKGLDSLDHKYKWNGGLSGSRAKLVSCGTGKLFVIWLGCRNRCHNKKMKIWGAEIVLEKRDGGEIWGKAKWIDVVHTVPKSCLLLHCLAVSV